MFIDEAEITVQGGNGGAGKVAFFINKKGPCGGNGGNGGNLYFKMNTNILDLKRFVKIVSFEAKDGGDGGHNRRNGLNGENLTLEVPFHTSLIDVKNKREITLTDTLPEILVCRGGNGGLGNDHFKTSTNRTPRQFTPGQAGEVRKIKLILKLIANYGFIGLPNAGKSSLLNTLTNANVKTANYPFTTLEPNLGVFNGKVLADIPGLIEGASIGKGLGIKFLKHIEKVSLLLHCISVESLNVERDYQTVMDEISKYNNEILSKKTVILLTKTDLVSPSAVEEKMKMLEKFQKKIIPVSIYHQSSLTLLKNILST